MAPILIDSRAFFKLGFTALIITALIFSGGFFAGYKKASKFYQFASEVQQLPLPAVAENDSAERNPPAPGVSLRGENIDVDQPAEETDDRYADQLAGESTEVQLAVVIAASDVDKTATGKLVEVEARGLKALKPGVMVNNKEKAVADLNAVAAEVFEPVDVQSIDMDKVNYSIQVGMYGNIINAENMVKMLLVQNLNAYISDYKNKKDEVRYNVRFGYFQDKRSAISKLNRYKNLGNGDGYLVRFSAENLVNMAKTGTSQDKTSTLDIIPDVSTDAKASENKSLAPSKLDISRVDIVKFDSPSSY